MPEFKRKPIEGIFCLMPLCLKEDQEIDYDGIAFNVEWLEERGIPGFIQLSSMGQQAAVSEAEFNKVCDVAVDAAKNKKIAVVVSSIATNTREVIRRAKYAEDAGADGTMIPVPYADPCPPELAIEFYQTVDKAIKGEMSIMLYNYPPTFKINITPAMWKEHLLKLKSIRAVKDSNMEIPHHEETLITIADKVNWFSNYEGPFLHDSMLGANSIIGLLSWVAPGVMLKWYQDCRNGKQTNPETLRVWKMITTAFGPMWGPNMPPFDSYEGGYLNALAEIGGAKGGPPRKPYGPLPREARKTLEELLRPLIEMEKKM